MKRHAVATDLEDFASLRAQASRLPEGGRPQSLWIACTDPGMERILERAARELCALVLRTPGFEVPTGRRHVEHELSGVNFAVERLGIEEVVICGHSHCSWCASELRGERPSSKAGSIDELRDRMLQRQALNERLRSRVIEQMERLEDYPSVRSKIAAGRLRTHGLFYLVESGAISLYDRQSGRFRSCDETSSGA